MATPTINVAAPARRARKGGLLSVIEDIRTTGRLAVSGGVQYEAQPCGLTFDEIALCYTAFDPTGEKTTQELLWGQGIGENFGAYYAVQCFLAEGTTEEFTRLAEQGLDMSESRALETRLDAWFDGLTPVTAASLAAAISAAENTADDQYVGLPIIHLNRADAVTAAAADLIFPDASNDGRLWTANGTPVAASAKYEAGRVVVTGDITALRSEVFTNTGYELTANLEAAIAERVYNLIVDCDYAVAIDFTA